jgi:hypothetical protein
MKRESERNREIEKGEEGERERKRSSMGRYVSNLIWTHHPTGSLSVTKKGIV